MVPRRNFGQSDCSPTGCRGVLGRRGVAPTIGTSQFDRVWLPWCGFQARSRQREGSDEQIDDECEEFPGFGRWPNRRRVRGDARFDHRGLYQHGDHDWYQGQCQVPVGRFGSVSQVGAIQESDPVTRSALCGRVTLLHRPQPTAAHRWREKSCCQSGSICPTASFSSGAQRYLCCSSAW